MHRFGSYRTMITALMLFTVSRTYTPLAAQQQPGSTPVGSPKTMRLCVGPACETLTWNGAGYDGSKDGNPQVQTHYTVTQWSKQGIRLQGKSASPARVERRAIYGGIAYTREIYGEGVYTGFINADGNAIDDGKMIFQLGSQRSEYHFTLTWDAEPSGNAVASSEACPQGLSTAALAPQVIFSCEGYCIVANSHNPATWIFQGTSGYGNWTDKEKANLTVQSWSSGTLVIRREDTADSTTAGVSAVYRGTVCGQTIKGTVYVSWPGHPEDKKTGPWKADIPVTSCDGVGDDTQRLMDIASTAARFRQSTSVFGCLIRAADLGVREARTNVGVMYRDGIGTKPSYPDALRYLKLSAIQDDYNADVAIAGMYEFGLGVSASKAEQNNWEDKARNTREYREAVKRGADEVRNQKLAFMGLTAIIEAMSRPAVYAVY